MMRRMKERVTKIIMKERVTIIMIQITMNWTMKRIFQVLQQAQ